MLLPRKVALKLQETTTFTIFCRTDRFPLRPPVVDTMTRKPLHSSLVPRSIPQQLPERRNLFDGDELDRLSVSASHLYVGKRENKVPLADPSTANKAAILSALAAFDSDDDERDDTYDAEDVGGAVVHDSPADESTELAGEATNKSGSMHERGQEVLDEAVERILFAASTASPSDFARDAATRRSPSRAKLRRDTGLTDEAIEGFAIQLARDHHMRKRLEAKRDDWAGTQTQLRPTAWSAAKIDEEDDENENDSIAGYDTSSRADGGGRGGGPVGAIVVGRTGG